MKKITKAVIPAAGFGTRFLPQTKAMPKEMMPLIDKPIIQRVAEELVDAGIETIVIVTGLYKRAIEDHFDNLFELEAHLFRSGKHEELENLKKIAEMAEFIYVRQKGPYGNATPILSAKTIMGDDPFVVFWGDEFIDAEPSQARQLVAAYEKYGTSILSCNICHDPAGYKRYGFVGGEKVEDGVVKVNRLVEKPGSMEKAPSNFGITTGFCFTPEIFNFIEEYKNNLPEGEELYWTPCVQNMIESGIPVHAIEIKNGRYFDTGNKLEYLKTVFEYGLKHPEFGEDLRDYIYKKLREQS